VTDWGTYIDRQIRKAMEDGDFDGLPGEGKPLNLNEDENTPDEMRLAYKILRENDLAPDWIMQGQSIDHRIEDMVKRLERAAITYRAAMTASDASANSRAGAARSWQTVQAKLTASAAKLNQEITTYNLKVPAGVTHKRIFNIQREISRLMEGV
jgi:DnaJ homolog subfamily C member 28